MSLVKKLKNKKHIISALFTLLLIVLVIYAWPGRSIAPLHPQTPRSASTGQQAAFDKSRYPTDSASSPWVVVNKGRVLPSDYTPKNLVTPDVPLRLSATTGEMHVRQDTAAALATMFAAAKDQGVDLMLASGYRSYADQSAVYSAYVAQSGVAKADTFSARPGHSEHQTGLAADIEPTSRTCEVDQCFENTKEGQWLATNAYKFGFVIRYQKSTQELTGYEYEPWHVRYVGGDLASQLHGSNQTLEQFFGLPAYTTYPAQQLQLKDD
jgi:D-alanyl-D-alanine carboxypeptidase